MPQSFVPFAEPYAPNLVPQTRLGAEPTKQLADLERFLSEELGRIAAALTFVPVQAAYCSLGTNGPQPDQPLGNTPTPIEVFDAFFPANPNRVIPNLSPDQLVVEEGGVYWIQVFVTAEVESGVEYGLEVFVDGVSTQLRGAVDTSNTSDVVNIALFGLREIDAGGVLVLFGDATGATPAPYQFIVLSGTFSVVRVSELHGRNASAIP